MRPQASGNWSGGQAGADFFDAKAVAESVRFLGAAPIHFLLRDPAFLESRKIRGNPERWRDRRVGGAVRRRLAQALEIRDDILRRDPRIATAVRSPAAQYRAMPKFPPVFRDIARILPSTCLWGTCWPWSPSCRRKSNPAAVFDIFTGEKIGEGCKSVAFG
jgi:phenylalanyl-tRNA synthetase beta subunit